MKAGDVVFLKDERRIRVRKIVEGGFISWRHGLFIGEENIDWVYSRSTLVKKTTFKQNNK